MQPDNQQQQQGQTPSQPQYTGEWEFLNAPSDPIKKPSFFRQNKKFIIVLAVGLSLLLAVTLIVVVAAPKSDVSSTQGATTDVPMTSYDGDYLSVDYASSMNLQVSEATEDPSGWYINFIDDFDQISYDISLEVSTEPLFFINGEEALVDMYGLDGENNAEISDVVVSGVSSQKTQIRTFNELGQESYAVYISAKVGDKFVRVYGIYPTNNFDISDSIDAMVGSIKIK